MLDPVGNAGGDPVADHEEQDGTHQHAKRDRQFAGDPLSIDLHGVFKGHHLEVPEPFQQIPGASHETGNLVDEAGLGGGCGVVGDPALDEFALAVHGLGGALKGGQHLATGGPLLVDQRKLGIVRGDRCRAGLDLAQLGAAAGRIIVDHVPPCAEAFDELLERLQRLVPLTGIL